MIKFLSVFTILNLYLFTAQGAWALSADPQLQELGPLIERVITFLLSIVGAISIVLIVVGGIRYILAGGDPKATMSAKGTITFAIIGLIVSLLAVSIVILIGNILGAQGLNNANIGISTPDQFRKP